MENLIKIQSELKVPKGNVNKFGNYKYRSAEDILEAVKPLLTKYNCMLNLTDEIINLGSKYFLKATATFVCPKFNASIFITGWAELCEHKGMSAEQATGTASSYARKYALNGLFLIDETESDADFQQKPEVKKQAIAEVQTKGGFPVTETKSEMIWLTEDQFLSAMVSDKKGILATLKAYNGQNGKSMSTSFLNQLTAQLGKL